MSQQKQASFRPAIVGAILLAAGVLITIVMINYRDSGIEQDTELVGETSQRQEAPQSKLTERETADGQVVSTAPAQNKVIINLGSADNLRLKQTFLVYDQSTSLFQSGQEKASLDIIRILDAHLAEARINSQSAANPILTRDLVVSLAWDPVVGVPVAIGGNVDLDGDGFTDLERLISIVEQTGYGKVVAHHDDEGNVFGAIDEATRFFVKGNDALGKGKDGFNRLDAQREKYQTREISVEELLNEIGWQSEARIQRFDENLPSSEFKAIEIGN